MIKIELKNYSDYICYAESIRFGNIYPLSIVHKFQQGDIFVDSLCDCKNVLFWHYCGFAYIYGKYNQHFLESVYDIIINKEKTNSRRFILFTDDEHIKSFFEKKEKIDIQLRYFYKYKNIELTKTADLPHNYTLKAIDKELLSKIKGRITPFFSWNDENEFLAKGKGFCIVSGNDVASWAFTSAISDNEIDIGVETSEKYQHKGFAVIVAKAMLEYILSENKIPVWACHYQNLASAKLAEKLGFDKIAECYVINSK
ncbi:MAG: GNAT family N-acetyltransferase [Ruminococcus sp.]|nr:GNAT family N-acetyltransferase [Ruminococcus sp.]